MQYTSTPLADILIFIWTRNIKQLVVNIEMFAYYFRIMQALVG